jgi:potassium-dependent mechanosensitive channel
VVLSLGVLVVDLTGFSLMAGPLGIGIGFGLQNIISNFVAGVILTFERPILPGDTVQVGAVLGTVKKIGVRASIVRSFDGADLVVPNNNLLSAELINWTRSDQKKRIEI